MKKYLVPVFKMAFILFAAYTTIATSKGTNPIAITYTTWGVVSTCPGIAANNETLVAGSDGSIANPTGRTFLDYGLPISSVRIGVDSQITGVSNGINRTCIYSSFLDGNSGKTLSIYTCADNSIPTCIVTFTPL